MSLVRRPAPLLLRAFNLVARAFPLTLVRFSPRRVRTWAERFTGLSDYGDPAFLQRLEAMTTSDAGNHNLSPTGRLAKRIFYQWHLTNRLREVDLLKRHPEIHEIPLPEPVIIVGGYRTGSTHLHTLLSQDPQFRAPRTWEVSFPHPTLENFDQDLKRRRRNARLMFGLSDFIIPDQSDVHAVLLDGPEECHFMLENAALSMTHYISFQGFDYAEWLLEQDVSEAYRSLKTQYQILRWQELRENPEAPPRPWLLKCPLHTWYLPELSQAFPDAKLIWTHRPMKSTVPSTCGLSAVSSSKFLKTLDGRALGAFWADYYEKGYGRALSARDKHPDWRLLDTRLSDVAGQPMQELERIYSFLGLSAGRQAEENIANYLANQKKAKDAPGKHRYTAEEFGLSSEGLSERFSDYETRFGV